MKKISHTTYLVISIAGILLFFAGFAGITIFVDPLFHYHAPTKSLQYPLYDDVYMDDGIVRNFDYDAVITGSSMAANFRASQFDELFGTHSIKVPLYGASYHEINNLLEQAFEHTTKINYVVRGLDSTMLINDKDITYNENPPLYLYDDNPFNDVEYVLNKDIYFKFTSYVFTFMKLGGKTTNFDTYKNYSGNYENNPTKLKNDYVEKREPKNENSEQLTDYDIQMLTENLEQNVLKLVKDNPDTEFYLFFPPYSILCFDDWKQRGLLDKTLDAHEKAIELLLPYDNIHLYSFFNQFEMVCDLRNYTDTLHYRQNVCDIMLNSMATQQGLLTQDNYMAYMAQIRYFYNELDYEGFLFD